MPTFPQAAIEDLSPRDLVKAFAANPHNSGGADGWSPSELAYMPMCASERLAQLLNGIERGSWGWPSALTKGLSAPVAKTAHHSPNPLDCRPLALLSI
eukprot:12120462-Alexandrium_andersonii.AAC.1